jgi:hypothetical protein
VRSGESTDDSEGQNVYTIRADKDYIMYQVANSALPFDSEDGGGMFLRNVGRLSPDHIPEDNILLCSSD